MDREPWPTEQEIADRKKAIRKSWTDREERQRLGLSAVKQRMSGVDENVVSTTDIRAAANDED